MGDSKARQELTSPSLSPSASRAAREAPAGLAAHHIHNKRVDSSRLISPRIAAWKRRTDHELGIILLLKMVERAADDPVCSHSRRKAVSSRSCPF